jgi:hypothetical protein
MDNVDPVAGMIWLYALYTDRWEHPAGNRRGLEWIWMNL